MTLTLLFLNFLDISQKNLYQILAVEKGSDAKAIKAAFYEQSKKLHPDTRPDDENAPEKFKELVEAYEVLSDPNKRKLYDDLRTPRQRSKMTWEGKK